MNSPAEPDAPATGGEANALLTPGERRNYGAMGLLLGSLLVLAGCLTPDASGQGTHRQLGLPPCSFQFLFGIPCPTCGMTTSWSHFMRGDLTASWRANLGGAVLAPVALCASVWALLGAYRGRLWPRVPPRWAIAGLIAVVVMTIIDWCGRLAG